MEKFPGLEKVVRQFHKIHKRIRDADEPCSFNDPESTFASLVRDERHRQEAAGVQPDVPKCVCRGWFSQMKIGIGIKNNAIAGLVCANLGLF